MTQPNVIPVVDYTSRDYVSIRADLINLIPQFLPEWTSRSESDFGIVSSHALHPHRVEELMAGMIGKLVDVAHDDLPAAAHTSPATMAAMKARDAAARAASKAR